MGCLWSRVRQVGIDPAAELEVGATVGRDLIGVVEAIANILDFMIGDMQANRLGAGDISEVPREDWAVYEDVEEPEVVVVEPAGEGGVPLLYENIWPPGPSSAPPRGASRDSVSLALSQPPGSALARERALNPWVAERRFQRSISIVEVVSSEVVTTKL